MFGLINMNGRVYDPLISRFLNVDPIIQNPYSSHDLNNYSYCINNPLKYIDPSGYARARSYDAITITDPGDIEVFLREYFNHGGNLQYAESQVSGWKTTAIRYDEKTGFAEFWIRMPASYENFDNRDCPTNAHSSKTLVIRETKVRVYLEPLQYFSEICFNGSNATPSGGGGMPGWASDANTGVNAFLVGNGAKTELLDYAVRTNYKSARKSSQFNKLRPTQQAWRTTNTLGKTGSQYLKYVKGLGYVGAGLTTTYSAVNAGSYYYNGGTDWQVGAKATLDVIMTGVGFLGPIGFGISAIYFVVDVAGGFGDFGEIKP